MTFTDKLGLTRAAYYRIVAVINILGYVKFLCHNKSLYTSGRRSVILSESIGVLSP